MSGLTAQQVAELRRQLTDAVADVDRMAAQRDTTDPTSAALLRWQNKGIRWALDLLDDYLREP